MGVRGTPLSSKVASDSKQTPAHPVVKDSLLIYHGSPTPHTVLGNLKTSLSGSYYAFAFPKYATRYLAAFPYRFNRHLDSATLPQHLLIAAVHCRPRADPAVLREQLSC